MKYRPLGTTGYNVSEISFGAWAVGGSWGETDDSESLAAMHKAIDLGVNFFDTADVYGDGHSEQLIRKLKSERKEEIVVATKAGRRLDPHVAEGYNLENLEKFVDRSRENLGMDTLDLVQLHCPPTDAYYMAEPFEALEHLKSKGKIRHWGASVARVEEGLHAMDYPGCQSIQIIFNIFRQRPSELFLKLAEEKKVGVIVRVPLSSGMLTGKMSKDSAFAADDHRQFNRDGAAFDKGETFSGVPFEVGLDAVEDIRKLVPEGMTMAQLALAYTVSFSGVTCAIPGGKNPSQVEANASADDFAPLSADLLMKLGELYQTKIKQHVHNQW